VLALVVGGAIAESGSDGESDSAGGADLSQADAEELKDLLSQVESMSERQSAAFAAIKAQVEENDAQAEKLAAEEQAQHMASLVEITAAVHAGSSNGDNDENTATEFNMFNMDADAEADAQNSDENQMVTEESLDEATNDQLVDVTDSDAENEADSFHSEGDADASEISSADMSADEETAELNSEDERQTVEYDSGMVELAAAVHEVTEDADVEAEADSDLAVDAEDEEDATEEAEDATEDAEEDATEEAEEDATEEEEQEEEGVAEEQAFA